MQEIPRTEKKSSRLVIGIVIGLIVGVIAGVAVGYSIGNIPCQGVSEQTPSKVIQLGGSGDTGYIYFSNATGLYEVNWHC